MVEDIHKNITRGMKYIKDGKENAKNKTYVA